LYSATYDKNELHLFEEYLQQHPNAKLPKTYRRHLRTILQPEPIQETLQRARKLAHFQAGYLPHSFKNLLLQTPLPYAQGTRYLANLLQYDAQLQMDEGQTDWAIADLEGMLGVARVLDDDPFLVCEWIRSAIIKKVCRQIERLLAQPTTLHSEQLLHLQRLLERLLQQNNRRLAEIFRIERAALFHDLAKLLRDQSTYFQYYKRSFKPVAFEFKPDWLHHFASQLFPEIMLGLGNRPGPASMEQAVLLRFYNHAIQWSQLPEHQLRRDLDVWKASGPYLTGFLRVTLMEPISNSNNKHREFLTIENLLRIWMKQRALLRCTMGILALERYRIDQQQWPDRWEQLVPKYLSTIPIDPETGQPMQLKATSEGLLVYSVGPNQVNHNGYVIHHAGGNHLEEGSRLWNTFLRSVLLDKDVMKYYRENRTNNNSTLDLEW
ncbi:MAG TPA: hypothetical protein PKA06_13485, partial [Gemmatales bacterium]|nr:hypothetical protein [Gemmatales bacterium]